MKLPKTLYLDLKKWRCGDDTKKRKNRKGRGDTLLENAKGYRCCLGQWIKQTDKTCDINDLCSPQEVRECKIQTLVKQSTSIGYSNTLFSRSCMLINDDKGTTVKEKIYLLRKILKKYRRKLVVKN